MSTRPETTFGQEVYDALKRHPDGNLVLSGMTYARRKRLRSIERKDLPKVFRNATYATRQAFKRSTPKELVEHLVGLKRNEMAASDNFSRAMMFGIAALWLT